MSTGSRERRISAAVGTELRVAMVRSNPKSGVALARACGIPQPTLSHLLNGNAAMDLDQFVRLCTALGVVPGDVLTAALAAIEADS